MIHAISQIFNSKFVSLNSELEITEIDKKATINKITFKNAEFIKIDTGFISMFNAIFSDAKLCKGYPLCDELTFGQECDGIFLVRINDTWHLCACELKSNLNQDNFLKAKAQLEVSVLKILLLLEVLEPFENIKVCCFIISVLPQKSTRDKLNQLRDRNTDKKTSGQIAYQQLIHKKSCLIQEGSCLLGSFPIKEKYLLKNKSIFFIEGNDNIVDILAYLN